MLPDFPGVKTPIISALNSFLQKETYSHPRLAELRHIQFFEGEGWSQGVAEASRFREFRVPQTVSKAQIIERGAQVFAEQMSALAQAHAALMIGRLHEVAEEAIASGHPSFAKIALEELTIDSYLALIDRTELPFESDGTPKMPSWEPPNLEVERRIVGWLSDPALRGRFDEIVSRKREEWNARESDRKLVD